MSTPPDHVRDTNPPIIRGAEKSHRSLVHHLKAYHGMNGDPPLEDSGQDDLLDYHATAHYNGDDASGVYDACYSTSLFDARDHRHAEKLKHAAGSPIGAAPVATMSGPAPRSDGSTQNRARLAATPLTQET